MYRHRKYLPVLLSIFIVLTASTMIYYILHDWSEKPVQIKNTLATNIEKDNNEISLKNIIHQSQQSIVQIEAASDLNTKTGSGFIINNKGDILTNAHVVEDADSIIVKVANTRQYPAAIVETGKDQDVAVIRVPELTHIEPIQLETEQQAEIGEEIIAIGSPLGIQNSVSIGLVVGTDRSFTINDFQYDKVYQISANITHGNSGGPLISRETGNVIGINSAGISDTDIGFSIPIPQVSSKVLEWIEEVEESELDYLSPSDTSINQQKLEEDSLYITDYLFENISYRDYVNAYSVLGSDLQSRMSYTEFRETFQSFINVTIINKIINEQNEDELQLTVEIEVTARNQSYKEELSEQAYQVVVGYENDQIKILNLAKQ